jgi:acyl-CoA hydrolase
MSRLDENWRKVQVHLSGNNNSKDLSVSQWITEVGQPDDMEGTCLSKCGETIMAMKPAAKGGTISRTIGGHSINLHVTHTIQTILGSDE